MYTFGFSPLSGDCLFLTRLTEPPRLLSGSFQSPQRGLFISYVKDSHRTSKAREKVSVPSAGIVYFLHENH